MSRHVLIIAAGAADAPLAALGDRTPLEAAVTPALDQIAAAGRQGTIRTIPPGFAPSRDVATLGLAGYDVRDRYTGYGGIEALGRRLYLGDGEIAFRCNFVTLSEGVVADSTAGRLTSVEARRLVEALNTGLAGCGIRFHAGLSYRALMVAPGGWEGVVCTPAHDLIGQPLSRYWPSGRGSRELRGVIESAGEILALQEVNRARRELGERPANAIWPWGQGILPRVQRFRDRFGRRGAVVGAVDLIRGVGLLLGWQVLDVDGATGSIDTDYAAKGRAALGAIDDYDLVVIHVEAAYEAALGGDYTAKIRALEQIDQLIVAPLHERLRRSERWSLAFVTDVVAPSSARTHTADAVPFCLAGSVPIAGGERPPFGETNAAASDLHINPAADFMEYFLRT